MASSLIENRKKGARLERMSSQMQMFCLEMIADDLCNATQAAKKAGYKSPSQAATRLLKDPRIQALLGKVKRQREERTELKSDDVWRYLNNVLEYNPLTLFIAGEDGWYITDLEQIPEEVGKLIEEIEVREVLNQEGEVVARKLKVRLVSKTAAIGIAARHAIPQQVDVNLRQTLPWSQLREGGNGEGQIIDVNTVKQRITDAGKRKRRPAH